jgi:hypothetical protein
VVRSSIMVSMNRLNTERRGQIVGCLVEGMSIRATVRVTGCGEEHDHVAAGRSRPGVRGVPGRRAAQPGLQADRVRRDLVLLLRQAEERPRRAPGHVRLRRRVDVDGDRRRHQARAIVARRRAHTEDCYLFLQDLRSRLLPAQRIQLTTDGFGSYPPVVDALWRGHIDYADHQGVHRARHPRTSAATPRRRLQGDRHQRSERRPDPEHSAPATSSGRT